MKIFLDTGDPDEVRKVLENGFRLDGITTNPTTIAKKYMNSKVSYRDIVNEFLSLGIQDISVETMGSLDYQNENLEAYIEEAEILSSISPAVVVKIPATKIGLDATKILAGRGIKVNNTLCFTIGQAMRAAEFGAFYISPFVGRLDDFGKDGDGLSLVEEILRQYDMNDAYPKTLELHDMRPIRTQVLAASMRNPTHLVESYKMGAHIATIPFSLFMKMIESHLLDELIRMQKLPTVDRRTRQYIQTFDRFAHPKLKEGLDRFLKDGKDAEIGDKILTSK